MMINIFLIKWAPTVVWEWALHKAKEKWDEEQQIRLMEQNRLRGAPIHHSQFAVFQPPVLQRVQRSYNSSTPVNYIYHIATSQLNTEKGIFKTQASQFIVHGKNVYIYAKNILTKIIS